MAACRHSHLCFDASSHTAGIGYFRPDLQERARAASSTEEDGDSCQTISSCAASFPGPLVLPGDDLSLDPDCPPQSVREWLNEEDRNEVTPGKHVIYVVAPPIVQDSVDFVSTWTHPQQEAGQVSYPHVQHILDYLRAFYHGLPVRLLAHPALSFGPWTTENARSKANSLTPRSIGLNTSTECVRIRTRASADGVFKRQLNLDDLLDTAISILPDDAYALLLLLQHDLYESADDSFTCGRAYGGSRVAVVSMARYNPALDQHQHVEREHAWPASHCQTFINAMCAAEESPSTKPEKRSKVQKRNSGKAVPRLSPPVSCPSALQAAVSAHKDVVASSVAPKPAALASLWLGRVCRTGSHELGHCFGIDHCVYYACVMQSSASLAEDARQPLYLCPVDLAKLAHATGADVRERKAALLAFCEQHGEGEMFVALAAWIHARMLALDERADQALQQG